MRDEQKYANKMYFMWFWHKIQQILTMRRKSGKVVSGFAWIRMNCNQTKGLTRLNDSRTCEYVIYYSLMALTIEKLNDGVCIIGNV